MIRRCSTGWLILAWTTRKHCVPWFPELLIYLRRRKRWTYWGDPNTWAKWLSKPEHSISGGAVNRVHDLLPSVCGPGKKHASAHRVAAGCALGGREVVIIGAQLMP